MAKVITSVLDAMQERTLVEVRKLARRSDAEDDPPPPEDLEARDLAALEDALDHTATTAISESALRAAIRRIGIEVRDLSKADMERVLGIPLSEAEFGRLMNSFVVENAKLIRTLTRKQVRDVMTIVRTEVPKGLRIESLTEQIVERFGVARRRAVLIARTETAKLKSQIDEVRQANVGVSHYFWRAVGGHAGDGRTRAMHRALHGKRVSYKSPPVAEVNGERHHPGRFPNCRCYAEPDTSDLLSVDEDL